MLCWKLFSQPGPACVCGTGEMRWSNEQSFLVQTNLTILIDVTWLTDNIRARPVSDED